MALLKPADFAFQPTELSQKMGLGPQRRRSIGEDTLVKVPASPGLSCQIAAVPGRSGGRTRIEEVAAIRLLPLGGCVGRM
jgi:hypothetical protein